MRWGRHSGFRLVIKNIFGFPVPKNLNRLWNFGSLIGFCLVVQIVRGLLLVVHYSPNVKDAFISVIHIVRDVNYGWLIRGVHINGASMFFICIYFHIARGLYYESYNLGRVWHSGVVMLIVLMATAFTGYILPWGQMSFWGATVITNMFRVVPVVGDKIVNLLWGASYLCDARLKRFFTIHFLLPFVLLIIMLIHLSLLHITGSRNPLGVESSCDSVSFHPFYVYKDVLGIMWYLFFFFFIIFLFPDLFREPENLIIADSNETPEHIKPEWYFLFAYCILRSIPTKFGGVLALLGSILILFLLPSLSIKRRIGGYQFNPLAKLYYWLFIINFFFLTYIGHCAVESPYEESGYWFTAFYFFYIITCSWPKVLWEKIIQNGFLK